MRSSLELTLGQHLTLTPQLQQAIRLLQLSTIELQQEIQQAVEGNPMLDSVLHEEKDETPSAESDDTYDVQWAQLYTPSQSNLRFNEPDAQIEQMSFVTPTLHDHLHWQLELTPMSDTDRTIAMTLIDAVDNDGFLTQSIEELHATTLSNLEATIDLDEIEAVKHRLQQFDPVGCVVNSLEESLLAQLISLPDTNGTITLTRQIIRENLKWVGQHHYRQLMKQYHINEETLESVLRIIQRLNPKPGSCIASRQTEYVIPDVIVKKNHHDWQVFLNNNILPNLTINAQYSTMIQRANDSRDNQYLKQQLQEARWFLKSVQSRQETLLRVATTIVQYQRDFFEHGDEYMKPLILNDVAKALDLHESTISRVTTQKFMHTPRGLFELKYFFSSRVAAADGGECSSTAIRAMIKKMIISENTLKPLSDSKIGLLMRAQGIFVARRTIAKYREAMGISPSHERKTMSHDVR